MTDKPTFAPQQLELPSLMFGKDRSVLSVFEVADRLDCTVRHVANLIEEGSLLAIDIAGRWEYIRLPKTAIKALADRFKVPESEIMAIVQKAKAEAACGRSTWRIPVEEGWKAYLRQNHSLAT